jgi:membrane-bound lytic murein transglycosylase A
MSLRASSRRPSRRHELHRFSARTASLYATLIALASCSPTIIPRVPTVPMPPPPPAPVLPQETATNALEAGVRAGPATTSLGIDPAEASRALDAFRISCPSLLSRTDTSGLTRQSDWRIACEAAETWPNAAAFSFFALHFEPVIVGEGAAFATGYFEPEIAGSRVRAPGYDVPVYAKPRDLLEVNPLTGEKARGRLDANGDYVLYYDRTQIENGALAGRGLEIAWAADPIEMFFLQIQGSGRLQMPDGSVMRIGYAGQNGREYVGIGKLMKERGLLGPGQTSMQGIVAWLRAHPEEGRAIMRENKSYIFFQELTGPGPLGALGRPVTGRVTVAADPKFVPLGAPVVLNVDQPVASGLWVAQDTGGAIKGANRFDTFWGAGEEAARIAGGMSGRGQAYILLPRGSLARLSDEQGRAAPAAP